MTSPNGPGVHSEPKIAGSIAFAATAALRSETPGSNRPSGILAKRNTPSHWWKINAVHMGVRCRPLEQPPQPSSGCTGGGTSPWRMASNVTASLGNSVFGPKFPVPAIEIPCFRMEQGIGCKLLNSLGDRPPKLRHKARIGRNFKNFPVIFPVLRECAEQPYQRFDTPSHPDD